MKAEAKPVLPDMEIVQYNLKREVLKEAKGYQVNEE
jgi:hypothetical protein